MSCLFVGIWDFEILNRPAKLFRRPLPIGFCRKPFGRFAVVNAGPKFWPHNRAVGDDPFHIDQFGDICCRKLPWADFIVAKLPGESKSDLLPFLQEDLSHNSFLGA